jgi:GWxTD domain-containing protein
MSLSVPGFPARATARYGAVILLLLAACGGGGGGGTQAPPPGTPPPPQAAGAEQTLSDLFNLTALYQRMGRLAGGNPLPFVGNAVFFAGRGDSTLVMLGLSLDNRALTFQRAGRVFTARYRVELNFQREGSVPLRFAREEAVTVGTYQETQRADESVVFQQTFLLPPGTYKTSVVVRDPGSTSNSRAEATLVVPAFAPGSFTAPILVYTSTPRADVWAEPQVLLNPRGMVAHGGDSLRMVIEGYGLTGPTKLPLDIRDEQDRVLVQRDLDFVGGKAVETRTIMLPPETPSLGRINIRTGTAPNQQLTVALVSFSRSWVVTNYDNLITLLRFYPVEGWVDRLAKADPADRPALWRQFWVETDPVPQTPENELIDLYFTRVAIANERFRDEGAGQGWRSERGEVYIGLGPPDQEIESPPGSEQRIIQWVYNEYRSVITFTGQLGFSRLRLTPASRSEFARLKALAKMKPIS